MGNPFVASGWFMGLTRVAGWVLVLAVVGSFLEGFLLGASEAASAGGGLRPGGWAVIGAVAVAFSLLLLGVAGVLLVEPFRRLARGYILQNLRRGLDA